MYKEAPGFRPGPRVCRVNTRTDARRRVRRFNVGRVLVLDTPPAGVAEHEEEGDEQPGLGDGLQHLHDADGVGQRQQRHHRRPSAGPFRQYCFHVKLASTLSVDSP